MEKSIKDLAYEVICVLPSTEKYQKEIRLRELRADLWRGNGVYGTLCSHDSEMDKMSRIAARRGTT